MALRNDCFALPAGVEWTPVDEALGLLRERMEPVTEGRPLIAPFHPPPLSESLPER